MNIAKIAREIQAETMSEALGRMKMDVPYEVHRMVSYYGLTGRTVKSMAKELRIDEARVRSAVDELMEQGKIQRTQRKDAETYRLFIVMPANKEVSAAPAGALTAAPDRSYSPPGGGVNKVARRMIEMKLEAKALGLSVEQLYGEVV